MSSNCRFRNRSLIMLNCKILTLKIHLFVFIFSNLNGTKSMSLSAARAASSPSGSRRAVSTGDSYKHFETSTMDAWDSRGLDDDLALLSLGPQRAQSLSTKHKSQPVPGSGPGPGPNSQPLNEHKPTTSSAQSTRSSTKLSPRNNLPASPLVNSVHRGSLGTSASTSDSESTVRSERADFQLCASAANKSVLFSPPQSPSASAGAPGSGATVHSLSSFTNLDRLESLTIGQNTFNLNASSIVHMPTAQRLALTVLENHRRLQLKEKPSSLSGLEQPAGVSDSQTSAAADANTGEDTSCPAQPHLPGQCVRLVRPGPTAAVSSAVVAPRANSDNNLSGTSSGPTANARPDRTSESVAHANCARAPPAAALPFARWQQPTPREASRIEKFELLLFRQRPSGLIDLGTCLSFTSVLSSTHW